MKVRVKVGVDSIGLPTPETLDKLHIASSGKQGSGRMPVLKDRPAIRWKLEKGPREEVVWISTTGDLRWDAPRRLKT